MWVEFDVQQPWQFQGCLSSDFSRKMGMQVWQVHQQDRVYVFKFLSAQANLQIQRLHLAELAFYQQFNQSNIAHDLFCLAHQLIQPKDLDKVQQNFAALGVEIISDILVLPWVNVFHIYPYVNMNIADKIKVFKQLCLVVSQLHQFNLIHGDLKPQHFFIETRVDGTQRVGLLDFAQLQQQCDQYGVADKGGTPAYMAPELFLGQAKSVQTDIYALGIIFYQLLLGEKPYHARSYKAWALLHCQQEIPKLISDYQGYQSVLDQMLAKRVEHRFKCITSVLNALNISAKC